ncbi:MAG: hypothetical protein U5K81_07520 [Trueperaceae bacterium]|nr:hypothetical protein [Trueperaceae bacterium]
MSPAAPSRPAGARSAPAAEPAVFRVALPHYQGDLAGLAQALRSGALTPAQVDLRALVRAALEWFEREAERDLSDASVALPQVARVVELKVRLLLPRPPRGADAEEDDVDDALHAVALLEDLEGAIGFLRRRRAERAVVVPAQAPRPSLPRPERPLAATAERLAALASRVQRQGYFELVRERFTLEGAMRRLRRALARCGRGPLRRLHPARSWGERTVIFAGMLELVRDGRVRAQQGRTYGEIELEVVTPPDPRLGAEGDGGADESAEERGAVA